MIDGKIWNEPEKKIQPYKRKISIRLEDRQTGQLLAAEKEFAHDVSEDVLKEALYEAFDLMIERICKITKQANRAL